MDHSTKDEGYPGSVTLASRVCTVEVIRVGENKKRPLLKTVSGKVQWCEVRTEAVPTTWFVDKSLGSHIIRTITRYLDIHGMCIWKIVVIIVISNALYKSFWSLNDNLWYRESMVDILGWQRNKATGSFATSKSTPNEQSLFPQKWSPQKITLTQIHFIVPVLFLFNNYNMHTPTRNTDIRAIFWWHLPQHPQQKPSKCLEIWIFQAT